MKEFSLFTYVETKDANNTTLYNITILIISQEEVIGIRKSKNNRHIMAKRKSDLQIIHIKLKNE